jgi:hypothetical protein
MNIANQINAAYTYEARSIKAEAVYAVAMLDYPEFPAGSDAGFLAAALAINAIMGV